MGKQLMKVGDLKSDLIKVSRWAGGRGWCPGTSGNMSVFDPERREVHIKESGKSMANLKRGDVLTIDLDGNIIDGEGQPSKEVNFHLGIYKSRKNTGAVLHTHPPFAMAFATAGREIPRMVATAKLILKKIPLVEYAPPGSIELANSITKEFEDSEVQCVLLEGHGVVSIGENAYGAYHITEWVEDAARAAFLTLVIKNCFK